MDDVGGPRDPRFSDPLFNGGQNMSVHEGDATRLVVDDGEERRFQVDPGDGHALTARPPAGTVGAGDASSVIGGPQTERQTHDYGDDLAERFGSASDTFAGSQAGWSEERAAEGGRDETPQATGDVGAPHS